MEAIPYADIIILALIAGFILLRLRSILGDKTGADRLDYFTGGVSTPDQKEPIVQLDEKSLKPKLRDEPDAYLLGLNGGTVADVLNAIKDKDPQFTATHFLEGARSAFEMVFDAFAKGDKQTLKMLLSETVAQEFLEGIATRETLETQEEHTLISVNAKDISNATLMDNTAHLTVHFISEQVTVGRNKAGEIVAGNASDIHEVSDYWTFERDVTSKSPNWKVIET